MGSRDQCTFPKTTQPTLSLKCSEMQCGEEGEGHTICVESIPDSDSRRKIHDTKGQKTNVKLSELLKRLRDPFQIQSILSKKSTFFVKVKGN